MTVIRTSKGTWKMKTEQDGTSSEKISTLEGCAVLSCPWPEATRESSTRTSDDDARRRIVSTVETEKPSPPLVCGLTKFHAKGEEVETIAATVGSILQTRHRKHGTCVNITLETAGGKRIVITLTPDVMKEIENELEVPF